MYICVRDVNFAFSTTFLFEFRTVPTVWYFFYWAMFIYLLTTRLLIYTDVICRWHCFIVYKSYPVTSNWNKSNSLLSRTGINRILLSRTGISRILAVDSIWYKSNPVFSSWYKSNPLLSRTGIGRTLLIRTGIRRYFVKLSVILNLINIIYVSGVSIFPFLRFTIEL